MITIGLTGSIGMGKSTTAAMFADEGASVLQTADAEVHRPLGEVGETCVEAIEAAFPGVVKDGAVDRQTLGERVFGHPDQLAKLNGIIYPMLGAGRAAFFADAEARGCDMVVLDIPMLFETGGEARMDAVVVVSAPEHIQRERVLARPGYGAERLGRHPRAPDATMPRSAPGLAPSSTPARASNTLAGRFLACKKIRAGDWGQAERSA